MRAIINGKIVLSNGIAENSALLFDEKITGIVPVSEVPADAEIIDAQGKLVIPGLVDMHIHGYLGEAAVGSIFAEIK